MGIGSCLGLRRKVWSRGGDWSRDAWAVVGIGVEGQDQGQAAVVSLRVPFSEGSRNGERKALPSPVPGSAWGPGPTQMRRS